MFSNEYYEGEIYIVADAGMRFCCEHIGNQKHGQHRKPTIITVPIASCSEIFFFLSSVQFLLVNYFVSLNCPLGVVMGMTGIDLLLGNDFLKQFGKVRNDYNDPRPLLTLGNLPLNAIHP